MARREPLAQSQGEVLRELPRRGPTDRAMNVSRRERVGLRERARSSEGVTGLGLDVVVDLADLSCHSEVADFTDTHLVYKHIFKLDVPMDDTSLSMEIS